MRTVIIWTRYASVVVHEDAKVAGLAGIGPDRLVKTMADLGGSGDRCATPAITVLTHTLQDFKFLGGPRNPKGTAAPTCLSHKLTGD